MLPVGVLRRIVLFERNMTLAPFRCLAGGIDVQRLAAAHAGGAGRARQFGQHRHPLPRVLWRAGKHLEGQRLQRIAGQDRGGVVEGNVHGGLATAQGIVVHRRQVVVHQRVAVHQFHRGCRSVQRLCRRAERGAGGVDEQRAHALAAIEHGVPHRRVQAVRRLVDRGQGVVECGFDARAPVRESRLRHRRTIRTGAHRLAARDR